MWAIKYMVRQNTILECDYKAPLHSTLAAFREYLDLIIYYPIQVSPGFFILVVFD